MARPKEFDRNEALQKAMEVFWLRGYKGASMQELVTRMGINRQSIYDTFGDKHALYLQALDRYREIEGRKFFKIMERPGPVKKTLRQLFNSIVDGSLCDDERRGCLLANAVSELGGRCKATAERACGNMAAGEEALYRLLVRGTKEGEIAKGSELRALARFLFSSLQGLQQMAKATRDRKTLTDVVKVTLSVLD